MKHRFSTGSVDLMHGDLDGEDGWICVGSEPEPGAESEPEPAPEGPAAGTKVTADAPLDLTSGPGRDSEALGQLEEGESKSSAKALFNCKLMPWLCRGRCGGA